MASTTESDLLTRESFQPQIGNDRVRPEGEVFESAELRMNFPNRSCPEPIPVMELEVPVRVRIARSRTIPVCPKQAIPVFFVPAAATPLNYALCP